MIISRDDNGLNKIQYGKIIGGEFVTNDISYYKKFIESSLDVKKMEVTDMEGFFAVDILISSFFTDESYDIKILSKRVY